VVPEASADDGRRCSEEAVRRLREESGRRVQGEQRRRGFASCCALATLAGGISLAVMNARDARLEQAQPPREPMPPRAEAAEPPEAARPPEADPPVISEACLARAYALEAILLELNDSLARARSDREVARLRAQSARRWAAAIEDAAEKGCPLPSKVPSSSTGRSPPSVRAWPHYDP